MDKTTAVSQTVSAQEMDDFAARLLDELASASSVNKATVLALSGDLGAGKTTLVQSLARLLGVTDVVTSPTFVVMKSYATDHEAFTTLVHMDAYRIENERELEPLNFKDVLASPRTLVCIEWPERISHSIPDSPINLQFKINPENTRTLTYYGY